MASSNSLVCTTVLLMKIICLCSYHRADASDGQTDESTDQHKPKTMPFVPIVLSLSLYRVTVFYSACIWVLYFISRVCVCLHIWHVTSVRFVKLYMLYRHYEMHMSHTHTGKTKEQKLNCDSKIQILFNKCTEQYRMFAVE